MTGWFRPARRALRGAVLAGALGLAGFVPAAHAQETLYLTIATGGTGGVFYPYGGGLAKVLTDNVPDAQVTAEVTGGSVDNVQLIGAGDADIGFSTLDSAYDGMKGEGAYADAGPQPVRTLAVLYDSFLHVVARADAGIRSVADLRGRSVSVGSAGSSTESIADRVLAAAGLDPQNDVERDNLSVAESAAALKDGKIDAFFWIGGLPTAAVSDLVSTPNLDVAFVETGSLMPKIEAQYPGQYRPFTLPKSVYAGTPADVPGLGVPNVLVVSEEMPDATVTAALAGIFDHLDQVHAIHPEARKLTVEAAAAGTAVPFHPAAAAFYKAKGAPVE